MDELNMLESYPLLIPCECYNSWKGNILINTRMIYIEIFCPNIPKLDHLEVCIPEIEELNLNKFDLKETVDIIKTKTHSLSNFLKDFTEVLNNVWKRNIFSNLLSCSNIHINEKLYSVIEEVNLYEQYIHEIDENLKFITFNVVDICERDHFIKIYIPEEYSVIWNKPLCIDAVIPLTIINSFLKVNTISKLFEEFKDVLNQLNSFWNLHEEIIKTCNVIGHYTYKDISFRIPIDKHVCVDVEIDVNIPNSCPKFNFHGQSTFIEKFQLRLNEINPILIWNTENNFKENILNVFGITDLQQYEEDINIVDNFAIDCPNGENYCFICYDSLETVLKNQIKMCVNDKCDALYHMTCICAWLLNSGNTPMFDHLRGKCPQCDEDLLVALENFDLIKTKFTLL